MQYLKMTNDMTLSQLSNIVGERNVDAVLNTNGLTRAVNIGKKFSDMVRNTVTATTATVGAVKQLSILNQFVGDSDLYEKAYLGNEDDWKMLSQYNCFTDAVKIPTEVTLPLSTSILGNGEPIPNNIYKACTKSLSGDDPQIDPTIFSEYNASFSGNSYGITVTGNNASNEPFQAFALPWGEVCLYSTLSNEMLYFPVYPEELSDGYPAKYDEMPEMLYQYEPWKVYKSSGPREISFTFKFHRDMWTGDHRDGCANDLIRGCEANCFPNYNGALVHTSLVTLYIHGQNFITGVMTDCKVNWSGPLGLDGFYLYCELTISITEVSPIPLNYTSVRNKRLIQ